ncbi:RNA polymerase factor sigma-54 [Hugenholtzia roseola]|uniref:RNA polymerase factor sigma-54 n=1 Tax=Hugenholtzia roseola TaxID=1002 RepID=UPI0004088E10|nr:RNA polymerase factor sigma-54 [Hugenholtzia roseola]
MQKLGLKQTQLQKLSPQQIQFIKLLQIPTAELESRIEEELESNPALEEGREEPVAEKTEEYEENFEEYEDFEESYDETNPMEEIKLEDYLQQDDVASYKTQSESGYPEEEEREIPIPTFTTLTDSLLEQLGHLRLDDRQKAIGEQLIGSIDEDGYIRRDLEAIANDLAFSQNIQTETDEVEEVLQRIQNFEPAGIAARDLQECLILQLERRSKDDLHVRYAIQILQTCFEEFKKKHFKKIQKRLSLSEEDMREAMNLILKLNPKPGGSSNAYAKTQYIIPDFILKNINGKLEVALNSKNAPELRVSRSYADMLEAYDKSDKKDKNFKQTVSFVKQKLDAAKWFIDAIKQRQNTLLRTMNAIVRYQREFFMEGDESKLRPMILKDIAQEIGMDISTVSRVANSKAVQTDFGVFPLKFFFSESISTDTGEDVSSKEVKYILKQIIENENKRRPLSDDKLEKLLRARGYQIARRTVAKYREQLNIPVARLRKEV